MLDALSELRKYRKIDLSDTASNRMGGSVSENIVGRIVDDINRISKNQFRLGQQVEDFSEEILEILNEKLNTAETYKKWALSGDELINELKCREAENEKRVNGLVAALIRFSDAMDIVYSFVAASGDTDWMLQIEQLKNSLALILAENSLREIGNEKFFDSSLHDAVSAVEDRSKDFREIAGIESKGYSYMGKTIRKARVTVNNYRRDESQIE